VGVRPQSTTQALKTVLNNDDLLPRLESMRENMEKYVGGGAFTHKAAELKIVLSDSPVFCAYFLYHGIVSLDKDGLSRSQQGPRFVEAFEAVLGAHLDCLELEKEAEKNATPEGSEMNTAEGEDPRMRPLYHVVSAYVCCVSTCAPPA
jgi:hypothetical protein